MLRYFWLSWGVHCRGAPPPPAEQDASLGGTMGTVHDMTEAMLVHVQGALAEVNFNPRFVVEGAFQKMFQNRNGGINARTNIFPIDPKRDVGPAPFFP